MEFTKRYYNEPQLTMGEFDVVKFFGIMPLATGGVGGLLVMSGLVAMYVTRRSKSLSAIK